jgi:hypothetical protein
MVLASYQNGNTVVTIEGDGTKTREWEGIPQPYLPESIDVKITDHCDMGCAYCHESSVKNDRHCDIDILIDTMSCLPSGTELAIGGGNPLSHPRLVPFFEHLRDRGIIANITVNQGHLKTYAKMLDHLIDKGLVHGLGISVTNANVSQIERLKKKTDNIVFHMIAGVNTTTELDRLMDLGDCKVLVLGYKTFGFGVNYHSNKVDSGISDWKRKLKKYVGGCALSFDNLAIEQLDVRSLFTKEGWERFYMGDDFQFTMYIDAVKQEYAPTSRSNERTPFQEITLGDYFRRFRAS